MRFYLAFMVLLFTSIASADTPVLITKADTPILTLSTEEVRGYLTGRVQSLEDGTPIMILIGNEVEAEKFFDSVLQVSYRRAMRDLSRSSKSRKVLYLRNNVRVIRYTDRGTLGIVSFKYPINRSSDVTVIQIKQGRSSLD